MGLNSGSRFDMIVKAHARPSISLLIVEDCEITLKGYSVLLSMQYPEATIYTACNGTTGLELFKAHLPDIVLTDLHMPHMDGREMAGKIRAIKSETKLIVITGDSEKLEQKDLVENMLTFDQIIEKPIDLQNLFAAIKQCIDEIVKHGS
jgi:YesN/AraC family two-component response regulator